MRRHARRVARDEHAWRRTPPLSPLGGGVRMALERVRGAEQAACEQCALVLSCVRACGGGRTAGSCTLPILAVSP